MPALEKYGAQPPIELVRQTLSQGGFYDLKKLFFKAVQNTSFIAACGPPGGGRNAITPRLIRHFNLLWLPQLTKASMEKIFVSILDGFLNAGRLQARRQGARRARDQGDDRRLHARCARRCCPRRRIALHLQPARCRPRLPGHPADHAGKVPRGGHLRQAVVARDVARLLRPPHQQRRPHVVPRQIQRCRLAASQRTSTRRSSARRSLAAYMNTTAGVKRCDVRAPRDPQISGEDGRVPQRLQPVNRRSR